MFVCVCLTKEIEYELPTDLGTTAVVKVGLLMRGLGDIYSTRTKS